jgi:hypothetical protein
MTQLLALWLAVRLAYRMGTRKAFLGVLKRL